MPEASRDMSLTVYQQHSPAPPVHRSVCFLSSTLLMHPTSLWWGTALRVIITSPASNISAGRWQMTWFSTSSLKIWKQGYTQAHLVCSITNQCIFPQPLRTSLHAKWANPERTKQSKMLLIYFPVWCVVTKQSLGADSKPYRCLSIWAFIAASHPSRVTHCCSVMPWFLQMPHDLCTCATLYFVWGFCFFSCHRLLADLVLFPQPVMSVRSAIPSQLELFHKMVLTPVCNWNRAWMLVGKAGISQKTRPW